MLNHTVPGKRVDVGRIDLMPGYSLFDVPKGEARRVVDGIRGAEWMGRKAYSEIADAHKDYARASSRKNKSARGEDSSDKVEDGETTYDYFLKKSRGGTKKKRRK